jgi:type I restriction enzyme, S subunit
VARVKSAEELRALRRFNAYPEYKASGVEWLGEIPAHWQVKRLRSTVTGCQNGVWGDEPDGLHDIACVRVADFDRVTLTVDVEDPTLRSIEPGVVAARGLRAGDLLLEKSGGGENQPVGAVVLYGHTLPAVCSNFVARVTIAAGYDARFLTYLHAALYALRINTRHIKQSTGIQNLDSASYLGEATGLPTELEQRAIAAFLDRETARIDALVAKKERMIELLQEQRTSLITRAVTTGLDPNVGLMDTGSAAFPRIPERWELRKLRRVIKRVRRPVVVDAQTEYREIGIRSWGKGLFHKDPVRGALLEDKSVFSIEPDDFVLNIVFAWEGAVGIATTSEQGMVASHRFPTFRCASDVDLDYLLMVLQTDRGRAVMEINSPGAAGRNRTIRLDQFLDEEIPVAPLPEQQAIVGQFRLDEKRIEAFVTKVREAVDRLQELRTALISAAVTGKIDVREEVT